MPEDQGIWSDADTEHDAVRDAIRRGQSLGARIKAMRKALGITQMAFAQRMKVAQSTLSRWENDQLEPEPESLRKLADLAAAPVGQLRYGVEPGPHQASQAPVVGYVGAGAEILPFDDHAMGAAQDYVDSPVPLTGKQVVAVRLRGASMPPMDDGSLAFYRRDWEGVPAEALNRVCVVKVTDGPTLVKRLIQGSRRNTFTLLSFDGSAPRMDQSLDWAAPVLAWIPGDEL